MCPIQSGNTTRQHQCGAEDLYDGPLNAKVDSLPPPTGELIAWESGGAEDGLARELSRIEGGGVLATAANLVFKGARMACWQSIAPPTVSSCGRSTRARNHGASSAYQLVGPVCVRTRGMGRIADYSTTRLGPSETRFGRILTFVLDAGYF